MNKYYLNRLSIVPIRKEPSHKSEMINQILFGEIGTLTNKQENWIKVALEHDKYEGWVDEKQLINVNTIDNNYKIIKSPFLQKMIDEKMIFFTYGF
jgi:SH3-like domain-containing protein